jgi:hypothetical protein
LSSDARTDCPSIGRGAGFRALAELIWGISFKIIETIPAIPALEYHVAYRQDGLHAVAEIIANGAVRTVAFVAVNRCETPRCGFMPLLGAARAAPL